MPSGVDARERVLDVKWTFYLLLTCVYSVSGIAAAMYAVLLTEAVAFTSGLVRDGGRDACPCVISLLVVTVMMPDNYCVLLASFAVFLISLNERCRFSKKAIALCALAATYCLANVAANDVPLSNLVFWCVYLVPFPLLYFGLRRLFALDASLFGDAALMVKRLIALEAVSVVVYGATHLSVVASYGDMDWVVGTMGTYQANTLMCVAAFSLIVMLAEIKRGGGRQCIAFACVAAALVVSTSSITYLSVFVVAFAAVSIFSAHIRLFQKLGLALLALFAAWVFVSVSPAWITNEMLLMTDSGYATSRIAKLDYYQRTFVDIPQDEGVAAFLLGTGLGTYSSRAAMTCAGGYIDFYDAHFDSYQSPTRAKYLSDQIRKNGLASMADSSVLSVQGELGFVALVALFACMLSMWRRSPSPYLRMAVLFFTLLLFVDNALEYTKFCSLLCLSVEACASLWRLGAASRAGAADERPRRKGFQWEPAHKIGGLVLAGALDPVREVHASGHGRV